MKRTLCTLFFFSGAAALIFEILWFQLAGITFGNGVWATAIVVATFMAGLALGSLLSAMYGEKIKSPLRLYAFLEIFIAIFGYLLILIFPGLTRFLVPVFHPIMDNPLLLNTFRAMSAFLLMLIPASAMGATLPVLVKTLHAQKSNYGNVLGLLYGWNTMGAVAGVLLCDIYLVKWLGIRSSGLVAVFFNLLAALLALKLYKRNQVSVSPGITSPEKIIGSGQKLSARSACLLLASFLSGFTMLALEVLWFRFMILFYIANSWNMAVMLAMVLLGISLGGIASAKWFEIKPELHKWLFVFPCVNGFLLVATYLGFGALFDMTGKYSDRTGILLTSFIFLLPVSAISGAIFTLVGKALFKEIKLDTKTTGFLTSSNTIGGMLGSLVTSIFFIVQLGVEISFFVFSILYALVSVLTLNHKQFTGIRYSVFLYLIPAAAIILLSMIFPFHRMENTYLRTSAARYMEAGGEKRVAFSEGLTETVQYLQKDFLGEPLYSRMLTNNYSMSSNQLDAKRYMKLFVYLPVAIRENPENALLICYGVGSTAKALSDTGCLKDIDIVDISKNVVDNSTVIFPNPANNPTNDPRTDIFIEDGRFFLLTTNQRYDIITAEPPPPKVSGIVNLYTKEYFELLHDRLKDGGIVTYWLPVYQLKVKETQAILKAFTEVFQNTTLWTASGFEWMMVGIRNPGPVVNTAYFERQWHDPATRSELVSLGFQNPDQFGSLFIADEKRLEEWIEKIPPLVDNYPQRLDYDDRNWRENLPAYREFMDPDTSLRNFTSSRSIQQIWPREMIKRSVNYFSVRQVINEMLGIKSMRQMNPIEILHHTITHPLLRPYILWAMGSDQDAQDIISAHGVENIPASSITLDSYMHFAARVMQQLDFSTAEKIYEKARGQLSPENDSSDYFYFDIFRIYFLLSMGERTKAEAVMNDFLHLDNDVTNKEKRVEKMNRWWPYLNNLVQHAGRMIEKPER